MEIDAAAEPRDSGAGGGPLHGIRVVDLTRVYSGPYCTFLLAMAGADVIKVEPPEGDSLRNRKGPGGAALPFAMLNANKRMVTLNLKEERGWLLLRSLMATADVLVENFRPGVMDRMGLGRDAVRAGFPRLIYASASGYGSDGPYRDYPAMDLTMQAFAGVMDSTGFPDQPPVKAGAALVDFLAGAHLYGAIVTALLRRERDGHVIATEVAMLDSLYPSLASSLGLAMRAGDDFVARTGNRHSGLSVCPYNVYPAADGYVAIICNTNLNWQALVRALGRDDLGADARFATMAGRIAHMDEIDAEIARETRRRGRDELFRLLNGAGAICGAVRTLREVIDDPLLHQGGLLRKIDHPEYGELVVFRSALRFFGEAECAYERSHPLGADNDRVFRELGLDDEELAELRSTGVI
ncbi:MAG: CaiB/BaiF CoA transferase family protein [Xanthobacteraceae bacterium]